MHSELHSKHFIFLLLSKKKKKRGCILLLVRYKGQILELADEFHH